MIDVDADVVLRRTRHRGARGVVHLPSDEAETQPACGQELRLEDGEYRPIPADRVSDNARLCKFCDPDHDVEKGTTKKSLAARLRENGGTLVTDGGRQMESKAADLVTEVLDDVDRETSQAFDEKASTFAREAELEQPINRRPSSIAAGAVYAAGLLVNEKLTQETVSEAADVPESTIRAAYQDILDCQGIATKERNQKANRGADVDESATLTDRLKGVFGRGD